MDKSNSMKQLGKNFLSLTLVQIGNYVLPILSVPVISRIIGPEKYGLINFAVAYVAYFTLLVSYSFDFSATRKLLKDPDNVDYRSEVFSEVFYTQCLLFLVATSVFVATLFLVPDFASNRLVIIFSYLVCVASLFTQNWLFQAMQDLTKVAIFNLTSKLLFTISILFFVRKNEDYIWQPLLIGLIQTGIAVWSFVWALKNYKIKFLRFNLKRCFNVLWEERIIFFSLIFVNLYSSTNTVILGLYQNPEQVGFYTSAQRLIVIAQSVLTMPLAQAFYPYIGRAFSESKESGLRVAQKLIPLIVLFIGSASVFIFVFGPLVIRLFYGEKFEAAIPVFQMLAIIPLLFALNNVLGIQIMVNLKMDKHFFTISALAGIISISLNLLIVRQWGYMGTSANWLFTEIFLFVSMYVVLKRKGLNPINGEFFRFQSISELLNPMVKKMYATVRPANKGL
ncbi:Putative O-antigen transporter [Dyadobacter sp. CECT 9623]|jgi:O-antigen/teichoic acid export membrane protein|uniref:O-antigen transporter n=1 Tax=Dyadobacter linearis TaxID=2823330 RepID=A0ABN7R5F9_9BACT|nr:MULTISPECIES: flippase [unclassified Dyadobacter]MCE7059781.1 flippase [Dyadobacter sp. CY343]CAG5068539.1 Putative O-antigen transporter [Dyadobacter sp. CECT 9623]